MALTRRAGLIRWAGAATICTAVAAAPNRADACSFSPTSPSPGILTGDTMNRGTSFPRNVAFVTSRMTPLEPGTSDHWLIAQLDTGDPIVAIEVPGTRVSDTDMIVRPATPLPENATFSAFDWVEYSGTYHTTSVTDDVAPSRPEVIGGSLNFHDGTGTCSRDSCGDYTSAAIEFAAHATDDQTPPERLVYAIYIGTTAQEVQTKMDAFALYIGSSYSLNYENTIHENVGNDWMDRDMFVAVAAIDQSGNVSERSAPAQINSGDPGGCAMKGRRHPTRFTIDLFVVALLGGWLRRRGRHAKSKPKTL